MRNLCGCSTAWHIFWTKNRVDSRSKLTYDKGSVPGLWKLGPTREGVWFRVLSGELPGRLGLTSPTLS